MDGIAETATRRQYIAHAHARTVASKSLNHRTPITALVEYAALYKSHSVKE